MSTIHSMRAAADALLTHAPDPLHLHAPEPVLVRLEEWSDSFRQRAQRALSRRVRGWRWRRQLGAFGHNADLRHPAWLIGPESIAIREHAHVWRFARLDALNPRPGVIRIDIGPGAVIQPFVHIAAVHGIRIGRGCLFASHVYLTDHDHDYSNPADPVIHNDRVLAAPVTIGDYVWLGQRAIVLKGVTIGERSIVGAGSIVTRSIPPLSLALGAPARVVRTWNHATTSWEKVPQP